MKIGKFKLFLTILVLGGLIFSCGGSKDTVDITEAEKEIFEASGQDSVKLGGEESDYEIIIIDPGFNTWLRSVARPPGYYSLNFLETRNRIYVVEWNNRVLIPQRFDPLLYEMQINYDPNIDYGYDLNYQLYNYFIYFQRKYNQRLGPFLPRI